MTVTINGNFTVIVPAAASETIVEFLPPQKPRMPWNVVVTGSTAAEIGTLYLTGPVDQKVTVSNGGLSTEPYDIREDDC